MLDLKSYIFRIRTVAIIAILSATSAVGFVSYGQQKPAATQRVSDRYSMSPDSRFKPELRYILVRLKGDNGVSIVDLINGKVVSRNFAPVTNSKGKISGENWTTPVLDDIFCIERDKQINGEWHNSVSIYQNPSRPVSVAGLTDLYSANIINPNLFPICRYGERIKFVDSNGNVKFTVMPIDGKEPYSVYPDICNGIIIVQVEYNVKTKNYIDGRGEKGKQKTNFTEKYGAIDTTGKWVIYPEWDSLDSYQIGIIQGNKDGVRYNITPTGKSTRDINTDLHLHRLGWPVPSKYLIETVYDGGPVSNIYDLKQNYIATIDNADLIDPNQTHPEILCARRENRSDSNGRYIGYSNLVDLSHNNAVISKNYTDLDELPDGNYLGRNRINDCDTFKCWYVKTDGTETPLPDNCEFPLCHPLMALYYKPEINRFIVIGKNGAPGYICDFNGNKIGNLQIEEFYNMEWEVEPVKSSYWRKHILGEDDN
ncbi:MAG: hypothetical protein K2L55_05320 [Muribaculaceae bacterium]|nr:hypothetical protein [Muribaculaceae bacterium]